MLQESTPVLQHIMFSPDADLVTSVERPAWKRPMPRVSSMLFDLELEDQESGEDVAPPGISRQLLKLLQPRSQEEHQLGAAVNAAYEKAVGAGRQLSIHDLADTLRQQGYDVRIRTALGGGGGGECLRNLRHQFLTLNMTGQDGVLVECIIDPSFAEQWGIARPTPAYARVVAALPQVYVGSAVEPLVDFLCSELAAAFRAEGAMLPPWRAADAMLSKWRPRRSVDCDMLSPPGAFHALHSPFAAAMAHLSRRSGNSSRPSKSQRLSGALLRGSGGSGAIHKPHHHHHHATSSVHASPPASPRGSGGMGSFLAGGSCMGGRPLAMDKSASKALSDAEAEEAAAADAATVAAAAAAAAESLLDGYSDGYADGGDASDSSNESDAATMADLGFRRRSDERKRNGYEGASNGGTGNGNGSGSAGVGISARVGRRASAGNDLSTLSSSWRASDCMPFGRGGGTTGLDRCEASPGRIHGGAVRMSLEGVSTSDGSDTTQGPPPAPRGTPQLALQGRLISAPPRLPSPHLSTSSGSAPQAALPRLIACTPSFPQPPVPTVEPNFDCPKPVPAKSALSFARCSSAGGGVGGGAATGLDRRSFARNCSGLSRNSGGRVVKCLPPLETGAGLGPGRQTSFPIDAASRLDAAGGRSPNQNSSPSGGLKPDDGRRGGHLQDSHSASAGELGGGLPIQGGLLPVPGTSPAHRAAAVRQHFGVPPPRRRTSSLAAHRSLFAGDSGRQ